MRKNVDNVSDDSLLGSKKGGKFRKAASFLRRKLLTPFTVSLGISAAGIGYAARDPVKSEMSEVAFQVALATAPITDQQKAFLNNQHEIVKERNKKRQRVIWEYREEADDFFDNVEEIADGSLSSLENFRGAYSPDRLVIQADIYRYGIVPSVVAKSDNFLERKLKFLATRKPDEPTPAFIRSLIPIFAPQKAYEFTRSSAVESLAVDVGKLSQNCDARAKIFIVALCRLYPNQLKNIFVQTFGDHVRVLFKIGNEMYILEGRGEKFPDKKTLEKPNFVVPLTGYLAKKYAGVATNKLEGGKFYGPDEESVDNFRMTITDSMDPFTFDDYFLSVQLGNFGSLEEDMNLALNRAQRNIPDTPVAGNHRERDNHSSSGKNESEEKLQKGNTGTTVIPQTAGEGNTPHPNAQNRGEVKPPESNNKNHIITNKTKDKPSLPDKNQKSEIVQKEHTPDPPSSTSPTITKAQMDKIVAFNKNAEARMEQKLETIAQAATNNNFPALNGTLPTPQAEILTDVIETDIIYEDPRYKYLTPDEWQRIQQTAPINRKELAKYQRLESAEVAEEFVLRSIKESLSILSMGRPYKTTSYKDTLATYDRFKHSRNFAQPFNYYDLDITNLTPQAANYLKDSIDGIDFHKLVLDKTLADIFAQGKNGYFTFYKLPPLHVLKTLKIRGEISVGENINEEQAWALVNIPMNVRIDSRMPPESLEKTLPILRQKKQGTFTYNASVQRQLSPFLLEDYLQSDPARKSILLDVEEFSSELASLCVNYGITEIIFKHLKMMDADAVQYLSEAGIHVSIETADFIVRDLETFLLTHPYSHELTIDGSCEDREEIFALMNRNSPLHVNRYRPLIKLINFPLTKDNLKNIINITNVNFDLTQCGPVDDTAVSILREAKTSVEIAWQKLTPGILDFLVAMNELDYYSRKEHFSTGGPASSSSSYSLRQTDIVALFSDKDLVQWLRNFRGTLELLGHTFRGDDPVLIEIINNQQNLHIVVSGPFSETFAQKVNQFQGGHLFIYAHNATPNDVAMIQQRSNVTLKNVQE